ncbi:hypothetical protein M427DRAFT_508762 [Gonapodya prolifera JEL478]|uniref:LtrA-domain-containing protein n=1 Tax=Gonapodya prolifera (strain JEL478) TaxID=1344416 RepID=A0A139A239_GONPJ|nr:hypothetical protein M427DRAFT_508762 [Gonapodya prolifera JEL478]|eukprot:KXS10423.1 hypothetical protein M427DRAFT_508762 [Gonapodya prolifera JEL478]
MELPTDDLVAQSRDDSAPYVIELEGAKLKVHRDKTQLEADKEANAEDGMEVCLMGSPKHVEALKAKLRAIQQEQENASNEKRMAEIRAEELAMQVENYERELLAVARTDTGSGATLHSAGDPNIPHHSVHQFGEQKMELIHSYRGGFRILQPIIRQYFVDSETLVREEEERKTSWSELFFDLVFVVATSAVGHVYISNLRLQDFIFLMTPVWRMWNDMVYFINVFGADDTVQRCLLYWIMLLAVTMAIAASQAIPLDGSYGGTMSLFYGAFLVGRGTFAIGYLSLLAWFPNFPYAFASLLAQIVLSCVFWVLGLALAPSSPSSRIVLWWIAIVMEYSVAWIAIFFGRNAQRNLPKSLGINFYPRFAINIEHFSERYGLFVILALGEGLVSIVSPSPSTNVYDPIYGKAALGLLTFLSFQYTYFDAEQAAHKRHASRRSARTGLFWSFLHYPLVCSLVVAAASLSIIVQTTDTGVYIPSDKTTEYSKDHLVGSSLYRRATDSGSAPHLITGIVWSYCGGLGVALACVASMMLMHEHDPTQFRMKVWVRVGAKYLCSVAIIFVGLGSKQLSTNALLGTVSALILTLALLEAFARRNIDQEFLAEDFGKGEVILLGRPKASLWNINAIKSAHKREKKVVAHG